MNTQNMKFTSNFERTIEQFHRFHEGPRGAGPKLGLRRLSSSSVNWHVYVRAIARPFSAPFVASVRSSRPGPSREFDKRPPAPRPSTALSVTLIPYHVTVSPLYCIFARRGAHLQVDAGAPASARIKLS
ncbi:hypothetical protein EVAR_39387_1 [Eumeta japonica]|uniref:Uncharacterized protein n=1 Tax=Eumeta variegata TaxID=151549 RepID=A0A4C1ZDF1_EUMVA|nr:hypothetical protein EVAR_39387_1 [Eumeta japonica]